MSMKKERKQSEKERAKTNLGKNCIWVWKKSEKNTEKIKKN